MCSNMNDLLGNNLSVTQISSLLMCVILSVRNTRRMQSSVLCWRVGMHKTQTDLPATPIPIWCYHFPSDFTLASFHKNSQDAAPPDLLPQANFFFFFFTYYNEVIECRAPSHFPTSPVAFSWAILQCGGFQEGLCPITVQLWVQSLPPECGEMDMRHKSPPAGGGDDNLVGGAWDPILECWVWAPHWV